MVPVRWAARGDAPKVYPLFRQLMEAEGQPPLNPGAFSRMWGRTFRAGSGVRFAVAEGEGKRILGTATLHERFSTWKGAPVVSFEDFLVQPEERGKGVGKALLSFAERHARALGAVRLELHVARVNEGAQRLYAREGWVEQPYLWLHKPVEKGRGGEGAEAPPSGMAGRREGPDRRGPRQAMRGRGRRRR